MDLPNASPEGEALEVEGDLGLVVRCLQEEDVPQLCDLVAALGWTSMEEDIWCLYNTYPLGFLGAFSKDRTLVSHVLAMPLHNERGYIGFFITREHMRGQGIGRALMQVAMRTLEGRNVMLNAVEGTQDMYSRNHGFVCSDVTVVMLIGPAKMIVGYTKPPGLRIELVTQDNVDSLKDYDQSISVTDRWDHMPQWLLAENSTCYAAYDESAKCVGYGAFRDARTYFKLQPLYAESLEVATALLQTLLSSINKTTTTDPRCRMLSPNQEQSVYLGRQFGITEIMPGTGTEYRMFTKEDIKLPYDEIYSITNTENTIV